MILDELKRLRRTLGWSLQGFGAAWRSQKSLRQWTALNVASAALAFWLPLTAGERALILALGLLVLAAEILNTAIEAIVDLVSPEQHRLAGLAKDCGSAGVMLTAIAGGMAWLAILLG